MTADNQGSLAREGPLRPADAPASTRLPDPATLFAARELRLRQLAAGHPTREHLLFAADLCHAQHQAALHSKPEVPDAAVFEEAARQRRPPLPATGWTRHAAWRDDLRTVLRRLAPELAGSAKRIAMGLTATTDQRLDEHADRVLRGESAGLDPATAPLIAAGLQVHGSSLVAASARAHPVASEAAFGRIADATVCPCCASRPVAAVLRGSSAAAQRFLHCALCQVQWPISPTGCARCGSAQALSFRQAEAADVDASPPAVCAECCEHCGHYLKRVTIDADPNAEPVADDLASLALDRLVGASGLARHGIDLLRLDGEPPA